MQKKLLKLKPFRETPGYCGPASLKIVLKYYGLDVSEKKLAKLCGTTSVGTTDRGIKRAAEFFGFKVKIKNNCSFKDIAYWLNKKVPVIVDWFTVGRPNAKKAIVPDGHYSVVAGLDSQHIYLQDPELGEIRRIKKDDFLTVWFDFEGKYMQPDELIIRQIIAVYK